MPTVDLRCGDALEVMRTLSAESVDAVVTDPPYGTGGYAREATGQGSDPSAKLLRFDWDVWSPQWILEALRISRGPVIFLCSARFMRTALEAAGADFSRLFYWRRSDPRPRFAGQVSYAVDPIVFCRQAQAIGGVDIHKASTPRLGRDANATGHPYEKPESLMAWMVALASREGDTVLDPFMGSGTVGAVCARSGRSFIGIDLNPEYVELARRRISSVAPLFVDANGTGGA